MARRRSPFGGVRLRTSGRWQATYTDQQGRKRSLGTFRTEAEAWNAIAKVNVDLLNGQWIDPEPGRTSFEDWATRWLANKTDIRPSSRTQYESLLRNHLIPAFGPIPLAKITPTDVRGWYAPLLSRSPGIAPAAYRLLRSIFRTAVEDDVLAKDPCKIKGAADDRSKLEGPSPRWLRCEN